MAANEQDVKHPHLVELLASRMRATGVTPKDIREECNVDAETVRLWMRGKRMPRDKELRKLAKMLDVDVAALRFNETKKAVLPLVQGGEHVTDEDELALLRAYRGLSKEWARNSLRRRAVELLEEFGPKGAANPWGTKNGTQ